MKLLAVLLLTLSFSAFSQETIRLSAGNSVTLQPQSEVRVVCEGAATSTSTTVRYCQCRPSYLNPAFADLIQVVKTGVTIQSEVLLYYGIYFNDCYRAMVSNPNCR